MSTNPCIGCTIRTKIREGCCVQGNFPGEGKTIAQRINGQIVRRVEVCEQLDPATGECLDYAGRGEMCSSFICERF